MSFFKVDKLFRKEGARQGFSPEIVEFEYDKLKERMQRNSQKQKEKRGKIFTAAAIVAAPYIAPKLVGTGMANKFISGVRGFNNIFPGASAQMPSFDSSSLGGNVLDVYLQERRRRDELKAQQQAEQNVLKDKEAAYNRDITVAQIQAQSQFYSQLAAAGGPSAAFPGGWLPGSNTLNVPPGNYGSFPNVNARVTQQDKPREGMSMQPWMIYVGLAALALVMLPFLVRGK